MYGPQIVARTLSKPNVRDKFGNWWAYHSRSDHHSKVSCWVVLFDLLRHCALLRKHILDGKVGFGINHEIVDFKQNRKKNFDLVICTPRGSPGEAGITTFADLANRYQIELTDEERAALEALPELTHVPVGSVHIAFEAKACMTEHGKARPRLYDELNSSHLTIHGSSDLAIAAAFVMINAAPEFVSSDRNKQAIGSAAPIVSPHKQPKVTERVIEKIREMPRRTALGETGFDAVGVVVIESRNDGTAANIVSAPPAPRPGDIDHYDSMIRRVAQAYEARFGSI